MYVKTEVPLPPAPISLARSNARLPSPYAIPVESDFTVIPYEKYHVDRIAARETPRISEATSVSMMVIPARLLLILILPIVLYPCKDARSAVHLHFITLPESHG